MLSRLVRRFPASEARLGCMAPRARALRCYSSARPPKQTSGKEELDFSNTEEAFRSKSFREVLRHWFVYNIMFSFEVLVRNSRRLYNLSRVVLRARLSNWLMKATVYGQFVAGEDLKTIRPVIKKLQDNGVRSILDYAVEDDISTKKEIVMETRRKDEADAPSSLMNLDPQFRPSRSPADTTVRSSARTYFYEDEEQCDQNMRNFLSCINTAADVSDGEDAFAAIKLTGLGRVDFLLRLSDVVVNTHRIFCRLAGSDNLREAHITPESFHRGLLSVGVELKQLEADRLFRELDSDNNGKVTVFEWCNHFQPGKELFGTLKGSKLKQEEQKQMKTLVERAETLAECAKERGVRLLIDAEQTYFQPAIRHIATNVLMPKYNLQAPVIYNTVQCYLKDAESTLRMDLELSKIAGFSYGVKLVRGAYMDQERERAVDLEYEDPILPDKKGTDSCYLRLLEHLLQHVELGKLHVMVATHNEESVRFATEKMREYGINESDGAVVFGQLLGMGDHITFPLGQNGYCAYKYVPYGPVEKVIPYLIRRAEENKGMLAGAKRERELIGRELWRRISRFFGRK